MLNSHAISDRTNDTLSYQIWLAVTTTFLAHYMIRGVSRVVDGYKYPYSVRLPYVVQSRQPAVEQHGVTPYYSETVIDLADIVRSADSKRSR